MTRSQLPLDVGEARARLLSAGRSEKPSSELLGRTLASIGAGAAVGLGAAGTAAAATNVVARGLFWKWLGVGVLAGAVTVGAWQLASPQASPAPMIAAPTASSVVEPIASAATAPIAAASASASSVPVRAVVASAPVQMPSGAPSAPRSTGLVDEIAVLDEARRAMAAGDSSAAIRALERHSKEFPASQLDHEAAVLRVESLLAAGQCEAARAHATSFLRANPRSPVAPRMNTLLVAPCVAR